MKKYLIYPLLCLLLIVAGTFLAVKSDRFVSGRAPVLEEPALKELAAKHDIKLGNFAIRTHFNDRAYTDILTKQFNYALADNTPNWYFTDGGLRPSRSGYNWKQMDEVMAFAEANNMPVEAHHFVWGEEKWLPEWLKKGNYSRLELLNIMKDHILTVGRRYQGRIERWTVVNEAFTRNRHYYDLRDWWTDNIGDMSYVDQAFIWAHEADPEAELILNDFNNEAINGTSNEIYEYVKGALKRGVPIDGIGMQMHIDGKHPPVKDEVVANMRRFGELGIKVVVTEFDVNMNDLGLKPEDKDHVQGEIYYEMLRACIESKACHDFAYLGITDAETWYNYMGWPEARPLMFDRRYQPKPAYFRTRDALQQT